MYLSVPFLASTLPGRRTAARFDSAHMPLGPPVARDVITPFLDPSERTIERKWISARAILEKLL